MRWFGTGSFLLVCLTAFAGNDAGTDLKALQGEWQVTELLTDEVCPLRGEPKIKLFTITNAKLVIGEKDEKREFGIKLDPSQKPKAIDLTSLHGEFKGKTIPGIYELSAGADCKGH